MTHTDEHIECASCAGTGRYDGECRWCKGTGKKPRQMNGYYIGFDATGSFAVDKILGAVACAGKAYHHTDGWGDETPDYDDHTGGTPEMWIQNAAIEACAALSAMPAPDAQAIRNAALREGRTQGIRQAISVCEEAGMDYRAEHMSAEQVACVDLMEELRNLIDQPAPRCAECDCEHGGETCNWIAQPATDAQAIRNAALREALHIAGQGVKDAHTNESQTHCNRVYDRIASMIDQPAPAPVSAEERENIVDEIESIISETHEMDVRDIDYAENIVGWLERHHPAALRALTKGDTDD